MRELMPIAEKIAAALKARGQTVAVAESSAGGLISAALLAVPGASAYFIGGSVLYTRKSILALKDTHEEMFAGIRGATEPWALLLARTVRGRCSADWGVGESGAAGPAGNRYGDPPGHACVAVTGGVERAIVVKTGSGDRIANMYAFATAALSLLAESLERR
ncbi:MAG: CinA family protein [Betaproteobacteria bacterium]|nr:CinA family protein [Betaproteobacteria bacterium]